MLLPWLETLQKKRKKKLFCDHHKFVFPSGILRSPEKAKPDHIFAPLPPHSDAYLWVHRHQVPCGYVHKSNLEIPMKWRIQYQSVNIFRWTRYPHGRHQLRNSRCHVLLLLTSSDGPSVPKIPVVEELPYSHANGKLKTTPFLRHTLNHWSNAAVPTQVYVIPSMEHIRWSSKPTPYLKGCTL